MRFILYLDFPVVDLLCHRVLGSSPTTFRSPRLPLSPFPWPKNQVLLRDDVLPSGEGRQIAGEGAWRIQVRRAVCFAEGEFDVFTSFLTG